MCYVFVMGYVLFVLGMWFGVCGCVGVWCWYIIGYGMYLIEDLVYVEFMGVSESGEKGVGA